MECSGCREVHETRKSSGGNSGGEPPVPIPNTEVKPSSADGTAGAAPWESRSSPGFNRKARSVSQTPVGLFLFGAGERPTNPSLTPRESLASDAGVAPSDFPAMV